jgi:copper chaperone
MRFAVKDLIFHHGIPITRSHGGSMKTQELTIQGMSCGHCVMHVRKALGKVNGLNIENVEIGKAVVKFDETVVTREHIAKAIEEAGYKLAP